MFKSMTHKVKLPILTALLISICLSFFACTETAESQKASSSATSAQSQISSSVSSTASQASSQTASTQTSKADNTPKSNAASSAVTPKKSSSTAAAKYSKFVTLTIDATKGNDGIVASGKQVGINTGDTVYTVLKRYCDENKIIMASQMSGKGEYISAIDGVAQFDCGAQSGWIYSVSGVFPQNDCNSYKLSGGENIKWIYTTDLGKSEEQSK